MLETRRDQDEEATPTPTKIAEYLIFGLAMIFIMYYLGYSLYNHGFNHGYTHGQAARVCAIVPGQQVVSTTADTCTYANAYGRATKQRKAI